MQIPLPPVDENKKVIIEDVDMDRRYADASVFSIMKSCKVWLSTAGNGVC